MVLTNEQVEILDLEVAPILQQQCELLLAREMINVVELDGEEFAMVSSVIAALKHESVEALPPRFSQALLYALPAPVPTRLPFAQTTLPRGMLNQPTAQRVRIVTVVVDQAE